MALGHLLDNTLRRGHDPSRAHAHSHPPAAARRTAQAPRPRSRLRRTRGLPAAHGRHRDRARGPGRRPRPEQGQALPRAAQDWPPAYSEMRSSALAALERAGDWQTYNQLADAVLRRHGLTLPPVERKHLTRKLRESLHMLEKAGVVVCEQRQRLAIARGLLEKPRVLAFDEAVASVDDAAARRRPDGLTAITLSRERVRRRLRCAGGGEMTGRLPRGNSTLAFALDPVQTARSAEWVGNHGVSAL